MATWNIRGEYMETCNCELLCPCITSNLAATPSEGDCKAAVALHIAQGSKDGVALDDLSFIVRVSLVLGFSLHGRLWSGRRLGDAPICGMVLGTSDGSR